MAVYPPAGLPACSVLAENEGILAGPGATAGARGCAEAAVATRPLRVGLLNLMPLKEMTECDLLRHLSATPLPVELELLTMASHTSRCTPPSHMEAFYRTARRLMDSCVELDGLIVTGAPVEKLTFESVDYWPELCELMDYARSRVRSTLYICWAAFAALYHFHGIDKTILPRKLSGVYRHRAAAPGVALLRGMDDEFFVPHSRFATVDPASVEAAPGVRVISRSDDAGVHIAQWGEGREFYITGHSEYAPSTLDFEYHRDLERGLNPQVPVNYYRDDRPEAGPVVRWRSTASLLFANWLHFYVNPLSASAPTI